MDEGPTRHVAVIGGGITGLTTAWLLRRAGVGVTVYEAHREVGGLAGAFHADGFTFDFGPHEFVTDNAELRALLEQLCGDDLLEVRKHAAQSFRGHFVAYPFGVADVLRAAGPSLSLRALLDVALARLSRLYRGADERSSRAWILSRFGRTLYDQYFGPYTQKVWGIDPDLLDARTASQRVSVDTLRDLLRLTWRHGLLGRDDNSRRHGEWRQSFLYVRGGIGQLQCRLRAEVEAAGGKIETNRRLVAVERDGQIVRNDTPAAGTPVDALLFEDGHHASGFSHVVSTIPLPAMLGMVLGNEGRAAATAAALPFRGMVFVFLRVAAKQVLPWHWTYFPDADVPFQRITEFGHFGADMSPPGTTGLTFELAAQPEDEFWTRDDNDIVDLCTRTLQRLSDFDPTTVIGADVVRIRHAYPIQVIDYLETSHTLVDKLADAPNVITLGRQGVFRYCNMNECMEMAMDIVPRLIAGESAIRWSGDQAWRGIALTDRVELDRDADAHIEPR